MSTQRRESRYRSTGSTFSAEAIGQSCPSSIAQDGLAGGSGRTAPPVLSEWLATNSLLSDYRFAQVVLFVWLVQLVQLARFSGQFLWQDTRLGSPPLLADNRLATGTPAFHLPLTPIPSEVPRLHLT
jgi:hypothetical protein